MPIKVAILHQGYIPHYRVRFYELLNQRGDAEYIVFHGAAPRETGTQAAAGPFNFPTRWVENREIRIGRWTAIYQPVIREVLTGGFDAVVLGHEIKFLSNVLLAVLCRFRGIVVVYWGFGYHARVGFGISGEAKGWAVWCAARIKNALTRLADSYLAYTAGGAAKLAEIGFPANRTYVLQNTIDVTEQIRLCDELESVDRRQICRELDLPPDAVIFLFIGRLLEAKHADMLIEAVRRINQIGRASSLVQAVLIGGGPMEGQLRRLARDVPGVRLVGEIRDQRLVARYLKVATAVVIPGLVGLVIPHAFAHARPVITRQHSLHSPEIDYVIHGDNGLILDGDLDGLAAGLLRFITCRTRQQQLSDGARRAREGLRMEGMAERFDKTLNETITQRRCSKEKRTNPPLC